MIEVKAISIQVLSQQLYLSIYLNDSLQRTSSPSPSFVSPKSEVSGSSGISSNANSTLPRGLPRGLCVCIYMYARVYTYQSLSSIGPVRTPVCMYQSLHHPQGFGRPMMRSWVGPCTCTHPHSRHRRPITHLQVEPPVPLGLFLPVLAPQNVLKDLGAGRLDRADDIIAADDVLFY